MTFLLWILYCSSRTWVTAVWRSVNICWNFGQNSPPGESDPCSAVLYIKGDNWGPTSLPSHRPTDRLTGVKCRAISIAKKRDKETAQVKSNNYCMTEHSNVPTPQTSSFVNTVSHSSDPLPYITYQTSQTLYLISRVKLIKLYNIDYILYRVSNLANPLSYFASQAELDPRLRLDFEQASWIGNYHYKQYFRFQISDFFCN